MNLPIYRLVINEEETSGVDYVALVDDPAILKNWVAFKNQEFESYTDYPKEASENAKIALRWAEENGWGDCGTAVGKARANQLANREPITRDTIARMAAFERHRENSKKELGDGCGRLMWLAWGGDAGIEWAQRKLKQIDKEKMFAESKVSFDYDETLSTAKGKEMAKRLIEQGATVYIISARSDKEGMLNTAKELGIPESRVYATGSNKAKVEKIKELGISKHYDNNADVVNELGDQGEKFIKPSKNEREDEFIPRCISYVVNEGKDTEQATAICYSIWKEEHKSQMQVHDEEKKVLAGPLMIADLPIYREDKKLGQYYVLFDRKTIEQICIKYHYQQNNKNVNLMHDPNQKVEGVFMFNDFIIDRKIGVMPPKGYESLPDGSWFGFYKVENPEVWTKVKNGEIRGFSVEGIFEHQFIVEKEETQIEALMERFKRLRNKLANMQ